MAMAVANGQEAFHLQGEDEVLLGKTFVAIDFETATSQKDSACAVGLVRVEGDKIVGQKYTLIRPPRAEMNFHNQKVHGLSWGQLRTERLFPQAWAAVSDILQGADFIVAHNAPFDRSILLACCSAFGLRAPSLPWVCTMKLGLEHWGKGKLDALAQELGLPLEHHQALSDARCCAEILLRVKAKLDLDTTPPTDRTPAVIGRTCAQPTRVASVSVLSSTPPPPAPPAALVAPTRPAAAPPRSGVVSTEADLRVQLASAEAEIARLKGLLGAMIEPPLSEAEKQGLRESGKRARSAIGSCTKSAFAIAQEFSPAKRPFWWQGWFQQNETICTRGQRVAQAQ